VQFPHRAEALDTPPRHQAKIANILRQSFQKKDPHATIEKPSSKFLKDALAGARHTLATNNVIAFAVLLHHLMDHVERILQIRIDQNNCVPCGIVNPGCGRVLMTKIARQAQYLYTFVRFAPIREQFNSLIGASVIYGNHLARIR
jgi:hypothetical protein